MNSWKIIKRDKGRVTDLLSPILTPRRTRTLIACASIAIPHIGPPLWQNAAFPIPDQWVENPPRNTLQEAAGWAPPASAARNLSTDSRGSWTNGPALRQVMKFHDDSHGRGMSPNEPRAPLIVSNTLYFHYAKIKSSCIPCNRRPALTWPDHKNAFRERGIISHFNKREIQNISCIQDP